MIKDKECPKLFKEFQGNSVIIILFHKKNNNTYTYYNKIALQNCYRNGIVSPLNFIDTFKGTSD